MCEKETCLACDSISTATTFTTETCYKSFKIQSGPLKCNSEKVLSPLKCKDCDEAPFFRESESQISSQLQYYYNYKSKHRAFRKGNRKDPKKLFDTHYYLDGHSGIEDWDFGIFEQCETHAQLNEREAFWKHRRKHKRFIQQV